MALDQQTQALLSYNADNPEIVSRIAQERGLTQQDLEQALNIGQQAAARYGAPSVAPTMQPSGSATGGLPEVSQPSGSATGRGQTVSNPAGMREAGTLQASPQPQIGSSIGMAPATTAAGGLYSVAQPPSVGGVTGGQATMMAQNPNGIPQAPSRPAAPMPAPMPQPKPIGMTKPMMDGGVPSKPYAPAGGLQNIAGAAAGALGGPVMAPSVRGGMGTEARRLPSWIGGRGGGLANTAIGDQAFQSGFNRARGIKQQ